MRCALVLVLALLACGAATAAPTAGLASWYGARHEGHRMANGCAFHAASITAAHRTLPLGTLVRVTAANGRSIEVPITDRGPYVRGRVLDLSQAAFARLDRLAAGVMRMQLEVVSVRPAVRVRCRITAP